MLNDAGRSRRDRIVEFTAAVVSVNPLAQRIAGRYVGRAGRTYIVAREFQVQWGPVDFGYRLAGLEAELCVEAQGTIVKGGLQQPDPGGMSLARAVKHSAHQPAPDHLVLQRRVNCDRPDAGDRPALVEKVTTDNMSFLLGHQRVEARV